MSKELSVNNIINEINDVLKKHLITIIEKNKNDKEDFENLIKNLPFIKKIIEENETLKNEVEAHKKQIIFLNNNLKSLSKEYTQVFFSKNKLKVSVSLDNISKNNEPQTLGKKNLKKNENGSENIELIVDDTKSEINQINEKDIIKEVEENLEKKRNNLLLKSTAMEMYLNNYELEDDDLSINKFNILNYDSDKEKEEEKEEEVKNIAVAKTVLLAQDAGEYATIDTASEEEQEEEEEQEDEEDEEEQEEQEDEEEEEDEEEADDATESKSEEEMEEEEADDATESKSEEEMEEDEEEEVVEIDFEGVKYYGSEECIGKIYEYMEDGEIGEEVGHYVNGLPIIF